MTRIFSVLALLAVSLLVANAVIAFAWGDFGAASRRFSSQRKAVELARDSSDSSTAELNARVAELEQTALLLREQRRRFWPHIWLGIMASLISLFVNSISITYFIGTNRWCREVADAYSMGSAIVERSQQLKRRSFLWSLTGILLTLAIAALGAAADPFASSADPAAWVLWHWLVGLGGTAVIAASFFFQYQLVNANHGVIQDVLSDAARIRESRSAGVMTE